VGPGWFLVDWAAKAPPEDPVDSEDYQGSGGPFAPHVHAPVDASVSMLSPSGQWFAAAALASTGATDTLFWFGDKLAVFTTVQAYEDGFPLGNTAILDLRTGKLSPVLTNSRYPQWRYIAANGSLIEEQNDGAGPTFIPYTNFVPGAPLCSGWLEGSLAPDGVRLVCLGGDAGNGKPTEVVLASVGSAEAAKTSDTFRLPPTNYHMAGWLDGDTFLLVRSDDSRVVTGYFAYNIATRKIADFALPFKATGTVSYDGASKTFADAADDTVSFFAADGSPLASVPCSGDNSSYMPAYSGARALVECWTADSNYHLTGVTLTLVNFETGSVTEIANFPASSAPGVRAVYPYVGNLG
jgi:hypothetical protein